MASVRVFGGAELTSEESAALKTAALHYNLELGGFYADVRKLSEAPVERGHRGVFSRGGRGNQAVHEMEFCFSIAV